MSYDELTAWLVASHPNLTFCGSRSVTTRDGKIRWFLRASDGVKSVRFVCDEGEAPREIGPSERKRLGDEKRGKRQPTKKSAERKLREASSRHGWTPAPSHRDPWWQGAMPLIVARLRDGAIIDASVGHA